MLRVKDMHIKELDKIQRIPIYLYLYLIIMQLSNHK